METGAKQENENESIMEQKKTREEINEVTRRELEALGSEIADETCPFCGGLAIIGIPVLHDDGGRIPPEEALYHTGAVCWSCMANVSGVSRDPEESREMARRLWNRRFHG